MKTVTEIEASIALLDDENLLDLHDMFAGLATLASTRMQRRSLLA